MNFIVESRVSTGVNQVEFVDQPLAVLAGAPGQAGTTVLVEPGPHVAYSVGLGSGCEWCHHGAGGSCSVAGTSSA